MSDNFDPRTGRQMHERERRQDTMQRETVERSVGFFLTVAMLVLLALIGAVYFGTTSTERQGTQLGQNIERPQPNPSVPRDPNRMTTPQ